MRAILVVLLCFGCHTRSPVALTIPDADAVDDDLAWGRLTHLCDTIGHRITGSPAFDEAVRWAVSEMSTDGFDSVTAEPVTAQQWVRGHERVHDVTSGRRLNVLTLGGSVGTPDGPVTAEVVVVETFDELTALGREVHGKIVLFNAPFTTYSDTVVYRALGPGLAGAQGAVAALVRSVTPTSLDTPHTGGTWYDGNPEIPAVAVTLEDAEWMARRQRVGSPVMLSVDLGAHDGGPVTVHNVVGEVRGATLANEVVTVGCHLDSWDVGQGAQDDAAGCILAWQAARDMLRSGPHARTLRVVLFANEEYGVAGASGYPGAHPGDIHIAAIESDTGGGAAAGFRVNTLDAHADDDDARTDRVIAQLRGAGLHGTAGHAGTDIDPLIHAGAVGFGVDHDTENYWPIHHSSADTLDRIDRAVLAQNTILTSRLLQWLLNTEASALE